VYCHDCNTANTVDSKYCKECGAKINGGYRTMMLSVQDLPLGQSEETLDRLTRLLDMAFWHNEAGNTEAAITASEAALAINPNSTTAHSLLGTLYEKKGDDSQAIHHFEAVLALNPESAADAAKLDQLRRGVHVKAVAPPMTHQLLPPVLLKLGPTLQDKWAVLVSSGPRRVALQRQPLYAAGAVTAGVLLLGLLLMRPWARAEAITTYPVASTVPSVTADRSSFSMGTVSQNPAYVPVRPMVLTPNPSASGSYYAAPALTAHNPFAGRVPAAAPGAAVSPSWSLPAVPSRPRVTRRSHSDRSGLPPLRLAALSPSESGGIEPAPVTLPAGIGMPLASVASIPQHTVVVGSVGGGAPVYQPQADPSSHIHITVRQAPEPDTNRTPASSDGGQTEESTRGDSYQQRALSLQQQGEFKQALLAYQSAIRAYEAQIASGRNAETAQRGLAACQTGLQICQQSQ